jgi:hypothetical protein
VLFLFITTKWFRGDKILPKEDCGIMNDGLFFDILRVPCFVAVPNWDGKIPPLATREKLRVQSLALSRSQRLSSLEVEELLNFLEEYETRYFEIDEITYHRPCNGGAITQSANRCEEGVYCAKCGKLPDLIPPSFLISRE